jgi:hypothetical protein
MTRSQWRLRREASKVRQQGGSRSPIDTAAPPKWAQPPEPAAPSPTKAAPGSRVTDAVESAARPPPFPAAQLPSDRPANTTVELSAVRIAPACPAALKPEGDVS